MYADAVLTSVKFPASKPSHWSTAAEPWTVLSVETQMDTLCTFTVSTVVHEVA
jgi:hypothetical protein